MVRWNVNLSYMVRERGGRGGGRGERQTDRDRDRDRQRQTDRTGRSQMRLWFDVERGGEGGAGRQRRRD